MRRLTTVVPAEPLGRLRRYSGKLYGTSYVEIIEFLSMKHRISKASVRALLDSYWRYLTSEVLKHGGRVVIPGVGALKRITKVKEMPKYGVYEMHSLIIAKSRMTVLHIDQEDDEDATDDEG